MRAALATDPAARARSPPSTPAGKRVSARPARSATTAASGAAKMRSCPAAAIETPKSSATSLRIGERTSTPAWLAKSARKRTSDGDANVSRRAMTAASPCGGAATTGQRESRGWRTERRRYGWLLGAPARAPRGRARAAPPSSPARAIRGELLLLGAVEEVEERARHGIRAHRPPAGTPAAALLQIGELGPLAVAEVRAVLGQEAGQPEAQLVGSVGHVG